MKLLNASDEAYFQKILKTYEQEFGKDKVIIIYPNYYTRNVDPKDHFPSKVESWDLSAVGLRVENFTANFTLMVT